eukprot:751271-Hanusia_phi.AAC.1
MRSWDVASEKSGVQACKIEGREWIRGEKLQDDWKYGTGEGAEDSKLAKEYANFVERPQNGD